ncbi:MAG: hypothetical protein LJE60_08025 [Thiocapsa sp.]|jgi:hypothetical protein|nr:hypothetical protein [Thiocapsa sp.]MCG6897036.1 hypothetical protein [Thiocapsa sp.]
MTCCCGFAYAQARILARVSRLPSPADWQRLASARTLTAYLEEARVSGLSEWVRGFSGLSQPHDLERGLRALARESALTTAEWAPRPWRPAIEWVGWLPWLPLFEHVSRGDGLPDWVRRDDQLGGLIGEGDALDPAALESAGLAALIRLPEPSGLGARWLTGWRERWPACGRQKRRNLEWLAVLVPRHLDAFRQVSPASAWALREALRERLRLHLHQHLLQPAALFGYLALVFLDLERLRAALLTRAVFSADREG